MPPPSTTMATGFLASAIAFSSAIRSALSAGGGCSNMRVSHWPLPAQELSHIRVTLIMITNQPRPRLGSRSRAPTNASRSSGTGGSISAVRTGFHDSMSSNTKRLFTLMLC